MAKSDIKVGVLVQLDDGSTGEVLDEPDEQHMLRVRYVDAPFEADKEGTEELIVEDRVTSWYPNRDVAHTRGAIA